ncbi:MULTISPECIES: TonB-dependent receptor [Asticcacaulis]|uniref:TonB-dependent receptor n=1 Tax=Asticcacaulis TaxID=76890 RepID=UPI001AE38029|nr:MULTISPECIES: TonB-dependent receptor [Asticcacaulis]MBP2157934.1 TonB-dependent receptor [Asticcacaulis solisilvae]MDR6798979.1 TonB-dependent receptor [Asticcacaulis sp. BE141]
MRHFAIKRCPKRYHGLASVSLLALACAAPAFAQDAAPPADDVVVVTGFRKSYADAVKTKRDTIQISDSISSDGLGRFPDLNVGEAVQRIPGIQINREADSRNATISLRGLPGTFARTTLNGGAFADPILNGSTPLGAFASDIFTSITVIKSPTSADLAGGLSGNIDLRIAPALARKTGGFVKLSYEYNSLGDLGSPLATIGYNKKFSSDFAVFGVVAFKDEKFRRDTITVNSWANRIGAIQYGNQAAWSATNTTANPQFAALMAQYPGGVYYPSQTRQLVKFNSGTLLSGAGGFEWKPADNWKVGMNAFYTERNLEEATNHLRYIDAGPGQGTNTALTATSAVAKITSIGTPYIVETSNGPRAYVNSFSAENINTFDSIRSEPANNKTWAINPSVEFRNEAWRVSGNLTLSKAEALSNQIELDIVQNPFRNQSGLNGITTSVDLGGDDLSNYTAVLNTPLATHIPTGGYGIPASATAPTQAGARMPGQAATVAGHRFGVTGTNGMATNELNALQLDAERFFKEDSFLTSVQFGLRFEHREFQSTGSRNTALGTNTQNITPDMAHQLSYADDFFGGQAPGYSKNWMDIDIERTLAAITPVNTDPRTTANPNGLPDQFKIDPATGVFLTPYGLVNNYWDGNYWNNNFTSAADITSAYVMTKFATTIGSVPLRGTFGLRYEGTKNDIVALDCKNCTSALAALPAPVNHSMTTRNYKQEYDYVLPSLIVAADMTDDIVVRFAAYSTYVRPQPRDIVPITFVQAPEVLTPPVDPVYTVTIGATDLKPYTSDSLDLSIEWYNRPGGMVAMALYQKSIEGYIGPITDQNILCPSDGLINGIDFGLGTLTIDNSAGSPQCKSSNTFVGAGGATKNAIVNVSGRTNQNPMTVRGLEFTVQQNLDFLPGFWKDFGGAFNYSHTTIDGVDNAGNPITLPSVSKENFNLIGYYETKKFGVRLVFNHRGDYDLAAGNSFVGDARTVKARSQLDASASYNLTDRVSVSVDAFNLTDATRSEYEVDPMLPRRIDYDGRTYQVTLRASF